MPLYEYQCAKCGEVFEVIQKFSDAPLTVHEACGGTVTRLISAPGLHFKGSGWYVTDYARASSKGGKDEAKSGAKTDSKSGESKPAESKPAESKPAGATTKSD
jgi:putative FmdB family regulatory protein